MSQEINTKNPQRPQSFSTDEKCSSATSFLSNLDHIPGLGKLSLSLGTEIFVGCQIGENVSPERPWVFVEKAKLEEDLKLHGKASEFTEHATSISKYPEKEMLIICLNFLPNEKSNFYLCLSVEGKNEFVRLLQAEHDKILAEVMACINRVARPWTSLGSEEEISDNFVRNNRCLFIVELQSLFPFTEKRAHFRIRSARGHKNAYMEMLPSSRCSTNSIMRKLVDHSTQSTGCKINKRLQVYVKDVVNKSTQYSYKFPKMEISKHLVEFIRKIYEKISSELILNSRILNFGDDYQDLVTLPQCTRMLRPKEIASYQDIMSCKDTRISSISWNPLVSGIVAAAYVNQPWFCMTSEDVATKHRPPEDPEQFLVLVWSFQETLKPMLYLHSIREVTFLSFCPYNENILVGGCSSGQIIVWDVTNKLSSKRRWSSCSKVAYQYQVIIGRLTSWIKKMPAENHIFPSIISEFNTGHRTAISSIVWMPPTHFITRYGKYETCSKEDPHMQILTASLSGSRILVYDLVAEKVSPYKKKSKTTRLAKLPSGLRATDKTLTEMKYNFNPKYEMKIADPYCHPIMGIIFRNDRFIYECVNPETLEDREKTTYFKTLGLLYPFDKQMKLMCSTGAGTLLTATWDGHNYDQGMSLNSERCRVKIFRVVHDGPVLVCEANPFFPEVLLTVGGTILAIWDTSQSESPLLWRKCHRRYCSGMWSYIHPLAFALIRDDVHYEYWDLSILSQLPVTCFKHKGTMILELYSDSRKLHVRKKTFITTDEVGSFKILTLPSWLPHEVEHFNRDEALEFLDRILKIKEYLKRLNQKCIAEMKKPEIREEPTEIPESTPSVCSIAKPITKKEQSYIEKRTKHYEKKEQEHARKELLGRKHIRLQDIDLHLQIKMKDKNIQEKKIKRAVVSAGIPVNKILRNISAMSVKAHRKIKVKYSKKNRSKLKKKFKEEYEEIEKKVLERLKEHTYKVEFNWNLFLCRKISIDYTEPFLPVKFDSQFFLDEYDDEDEIT